MTIARVAAKGCYIGHRYHKINASNKNSCLDTFGRLPSTPDVSSAFKYFTICVCYNRVRHSCHLLCHELLMSVIANGFLKNSADRLKQQFLLFKYLNSINELSFSNKLGQLPINSLKFYPSIFCFTLISFREIPMFSPPNMFWVTICQSFTPYGPNSMCQYH